MKNETQADISTEELAGPQLEERERTRAALYEEFKEVSSRDIKAKRHQSIPWVTETVRVQTGNFVGELTYDYAFKDRQFHFQTVEYKITRLNGQSGGNKANINILLWNDVGGYTQWGHNSPDAMWQDGLTHNYPNAQVSLREWGWTTVWVEFIFDKSGGDPRKSTTKQYVRS